MDQFLLAVAICGLQVSLVSVVGLLATCVTRRRPLLAKASISGALMVIALLTITLPLPVPNWKLSNVGFLSAQGQPSRRASAVQADRETASRPQNQGVNSGVDTHAPSAGMINLSQLVNGVSRFSRDAVGGSAAVRAWCLSLALLGLSFLGCVKFCVGLRFSTRVVKHSRGVVDLRARVLLRCLQSQLCPDSHIRLVESDEITTAAVSGVWSPVIVLPSRWPQWSDLQLRSVLAHELAHIRRHDFLWRLFSCCVAIVHYYNPLVHWLVRHLALTQESAADRLAAQVVGPQNYVRALASLALEHDDTHDYFTEAGLLPVFSGYLIRRIKMLRKTQDWSFSRESLLPGRIAMGVLMCLGAALFAARGIAQQASAKTGDGQPTARIARLGAKNPQPAADPIAGMFRRQLNDPDTIPENDFGAFKIRFADLLEAVHAGPAVPQLNNVASAGLQGWLKSPQAIELDVSQIDTLFGLLKFETRYNAEAEIDKHSIMFGSSGMQVRLKQELDLTNWIERFVPAAKVTEEDGLKRFAMPMIPAIGPVPILVASKDPKTLCFGAMLVRSGNVNDPTAEETLKAEVTHENQPNQSAWASAFRRVDGGLLTVVSTNKGVSEPDDFRLADDMDVSEKAANLAFHRLEHAFEILAVGLDISEDGKSIGLQIRLTCTDAIVADAIAEDVRLLAKIGREQMSAEAQSDQAVDDELYKLATRQFLERVVIGQITNDDGSFDVVVRSAIDNPAGLGALLIHAVLSDASDVTVTAREVTPGLE